MLEKIQEQLKTAMKARDELRTSVLRMLISDLKYAQIEKRSSLTDTESLEVVQKAMKKRKEAAELYEKGGRPELAAKENAELKILEAYAPAQMNEETARQKVQEVIEELGAKEKKDLGRVMKEVLARFRGQIDGKLAQKIVNDLLK